MDLHEGGGRLEDRRGPAALSTTSLPPRPARRGRTTTIPDRPDPAPTGTGTGGGWIVSPAYDLLFLANLGWLLLLVPGMATSSDTAVDFWQVYFLTLPHRWITLFLVALDPDRRGGRGLRLGMIAVAFLILVTGVWIGTEAFLCLGVIDYLWNSWHFAAQHGGVLRMYTRKVGGGSEWLERHGVRFFVVYATLRTAGWTTGWLEADSGSFAYLRAIDLAVLTVPALLVGSVLVGFRHDRTGKALYLASLCALYWGLILSLSFGWSGGVIVLATASGLFHAVEYLGVVTHYAQRRRSTGNAGAFRSLAKHWLLYLGLYVALLGALGVWMERGGAGSRWFELWAGLNLWAAFVHYAYDGMIWKLRRPETARALGVENGGA
ncbi:hypothetical protein BH23PLA1_BH23PLA1_07070 [soil metagenome]